MLSSWATLVRDLFSRRRISRLDRPARTRPASRLAGIHRGESLEDRRLMAFDLVAAYAQADSPFFVMGSVAETLTEPPQQITLRFSPGAKIDPNTLGSITVVRSGGAGDGFAGAGSSADVTVVPGSILVGDLPNENEVVIRFKESLPDDSYRITVGSGLKTLTGDSMIAPRSFDVRLDLGAFVVSVVPQPVTRGASGLVQSRNRIDVHFNREDPLDLASAQNRLFYRLFEVDAATGEDVSPLAPVNPTSVVYAPATGKATLTFAAGAIANGKLYRLQIGAAETIVAASPLVTEGSDSNSSFATARDLGLLDSAGKTVDGDIAPPANAGRLNSPAGTLGFPTQIGTIDEPGHRQETFVPIDSHEHGLPGWSTSPDPGIGVQYYNFQSAYGVDGQGNTLTNAITETQKQRVREVFELFSRYTGIRFVESTSSGMTVATGDVRALSPTTPPTAVAGMASPPSTAIMSSLVDWGQSEYAGRYFIVAMHEIGHALGLEHSYDLPSIMGAGLTGEPVFPGDYDTIHLAQLFPAIGSDVDTYRFTVATPGTLSAETVVARPGQVASSLLDSLLTIYREETVNGRTVRTLVARNDDSFGRDSFIGLELEPGTYFVTVTSAGNDRFNPEVSDSGYGGRSDGDYRLKLGFQPRSTALSTLVDASGTLLDGDRDGAPGGAFNFWFRTAASTGVAATNKTIFVDKAAATAGTGDGTLANPFKRIDLALAAAGPGSIVRIVGNTAGLQGTAIPYLVGKTPNDQPLADGTTFDVPKGVTVMIDEGVVLKLRAAIVDVGSSSPLVDRSGAAIQVLGTPDRNVVFSSYHDDTVGTPVTSLTKPGGDDGVGPAAAGGQWGGIVLRKDSDSSTKKAFVNSISGASIRYGGGRVLVNSVLDSYAPIQLESARPTIAFNTITDSAGAAIAADPNSFEESNGRVGPEIRGNRLIEVRPDQAAPHQNSINGLFVKIRTNLGQPVDKLDVPARFKSTDIVYVLQENLLINGGVGGYSLNSTTGNVEARKSGRLAIDPGVVVKLQGSRIELERGTSQLIAEGTAFQGVVFTSLGDNRYGAGGTFDTNGNLPDFRSAGDWGGIVLNAGAKASIDHAYVAFGGGSTPIEGSFDRFNVIEVHQGDLRVAHSRIENNAAGTATTSRAGRGDNAPATIFVRGAQPVILDNDFRNNLGAAVSVNANALSDVERPDPGRSTGRIDRDRRFDDNRGPLVRGNRLPFDPVAGAISGIQVRGEEITVESVWDDTDIVHVLQGEIVVKNFHTATGVRLLSRPDASLIVKLLDPDGSGPIVAGLTASGYQLDIEDRIGGTVQIVGQPGYPVILTSLKDDTVGAGVDPLGRIVRDTGNDGATTPTAGDWRSLAFQPYSNDRNVAVVGEVEKPLTGGNDANGLPTSAQNLGVLAPNLASGTNSTESAQEKSGDENRRLGFEVHGRIAVDDVSDVDVYSFSGYAGSEVWIDIDKTSPGLDALVELLDASGVVLARSADSQTDSLLSSETRGIGLPLQKTPAFGGDYYTLNPKDPGMRVVLPSLAGQPAGTLTQYFVRVRSQPRYEPSTTGVDNGGVTATDQATYEADLRDSGKLKSGATSGGYELRIRLRQQDEKPGSTVRYADIRYPTIGIDVQGLPRSSPLVGESGESSATNDTFDTAQYVGNLLQSDRGAIGIAGVMQSATDVDWYTFALNFEQIQAIGGVSSALKTWATVFDIDYGDGFRGDLTLSVFDEDGRLLFVGRDSNVASDRPAAGQGNDFDDLSRGSLGALDPFIGSVQLATGNPTGGGSIEAIQDTMPPDPSAQLRYYVAVSSNQRLPTVLDAFFKQDATSSLVRLEPLDSVTRVAEDHIGFSGYLTGPESTLPPFPRLSNPQQTLFDLTSATTLDLHVTPFTLSDVTLFVYTATTIETVDAMRGGRETTLSSVLVPPLNPSGDITMRTDGKLFQYRPGSNAGILYSVDTVTGATTQVGDDNIPAPPGAAPAASAQETLTPQELGGTRSTFQLANAGLQLATVNGTLRYTDTTGGVGGTSVTYTWSFTSNASGVLSFTNIPTPAPPVGFAAPTTGTVTVGAYSGNTLQNATATINWSAPIDMTKVTMSIQYTYEAPAAPNDNVVASSAVDALAFLRVPGSGTSYQLYYSVNTGGQSALYRANPVSGDAATSRIGTGVIGGGSVGVVTGLAFVNATMYGVDTLGNFFRFASDINGQPTLAVTILGNVPGASFQGLTPGPKNLQNGAFANRLFAITGDGTLYCFNTAGNLQQVFDSDGNGTADATLINSGATSGVLGLAFSPLDINLWHPTTRKGREAGHGVNLSPNFTRESMDDSKYAVTVQDKEFLLSEGMVSMHFGLETYVNPNTGTATPYLNYQSGDGQLGVVNGQWQQDLTGANTMIGNNYNLPGGAYGSLITNTFSLAGSTYTDKPTLYFNYWLQTQNASGAYDKDDMRDSARVFVSTNGGPWQVVATNNSTRSAYETDKGELPNFISASSALTTKVNQNVQELYDSGAWRQARIDLGNWAGTPNLRLRFDFSTAGEFDSQQRDSSGNLTNSIASYAGTTGDFRSRDRGNNNAHEGFYIDDVVIGHAERGEMVTGATAPQTNFFDIFTPEPKKDYLAEQSLTGPYQLEIRRGTPYGVLPQKNQPDVGITQTYGTNEDLVAARGYLGDANQPREQGQFLVENNTISDAATYGIRIDAAVRDAGTNAAVPGTPRNLPVLNSARLVPGVVVTNNVLANSGTAGILFSGDAGVGPVAAVPFGRIVNNTIYGGDGISEAAVTVTFEKLTGVAATNTGVYRADVGAAFKSISSITVRDNSSLLGGAAGKYSGFDLDAIKFSTLLTTDATQVEALQGLTVFDFTPTGTTLALGTQRPTTNPVEIGPFEGTTNGVIDNTQATLQSFDAYPYIGPNYRGAVSLGDNGSITFTFAQPVVVNGPLYLYLGESGDNGEVAASNITIRGVIATTGVVVQENAGPTLLNNLFANLATGVKVDASSQATTVIGGSAYHAVTTQVAGATQSQEISLASDPFVNAAGRNFYLAAGTGAIDSSVNSLGDRPAMVAVTSPLGIPESPILAPDGDLYGQLRGDDPDQASFPGLGSNVFKDRGAIDRVDFTKPSASLAVPLDNAPADDDVAIDSVRLKRGDARSITRFEIQLDDVGVGIDKSTVTSTAFELRRDGAILVAGTDYVFNYLESSNRVVFESSSVFRLGLYTISVEQAAVNGAAPANVITDLAGNPLLGNKSDGTTSFTIELVDGPLAPSNLVASSGDARVSLAWTAPPPGDGTPLLRYEVERSETADFSGRTIMITVPSTNVTLVDSPLDNGMLYWYRVRAVNVSGESDWSNVAGPVVPLSIPIFSLAADSGTSSSDAVTNNGLVNVSGVLPGAGWESSIDGGSTWTPGTGLTFTLPSNARYAAGAVQVRQVRSGWRSTAASNPTAITVDTINPTAPSLALGIGVADGADLNEATQASGVVTVLGEAGADISVTFVRGPNSVTKQVTGTGSPVAVVLTMTEARTTLGGGTINVSATQTDLAGNAQTAPPATLSFTLDASMPTIARVIDNVPAFVGTVPQGGRTNDNELRVVGTAVPGATVVIRNGSTVLGSVTADGAGNWEYTTSRLADGVHSLTAIATDVFGSTSVASSAYTFTVDTLAPAAATITAVSDNVGTVTGNVPNGGRTDDTTLRITGTAEPGSRVSVRSGNAVLRTVMANASGNWVVVTDPLAVRLHNLNALARDEAGNSGPASPNHTVTVDLTAPNMLSLGTTTPAGIFTPGDTIELFANASERMRAGSAIDVTMSTGAVVRLSTVAESSRLTGTYRVTAGSAATLSIVAVTNVFPIASDIAGNPVAGLPAVPVVLTGISVDATIRAFAAGFASDPALAPSKTAAVTSIPIVFTTEVTGVSIANFQLFYNDRESISLHNATITGSGRNYTLTLPPNLTYRAGLYRLIVGPSASIVTVDGFGSMTLASNLYWRQV